MNDTQCSGCDKDLDGNGNHWHFIRFDTKTFVFCDKCWSKIVKFVEGLK